MTSSTQGTGRRREPSSGDSTEAALLDAAERLFSEHGYEGTSIRAIAESAGANLGALHYYWGTKGSLFKAMCERRLRPVVEDRLRRFDACVAEARGGPPDLKSVLEASIFPALAREDESPEQRETMGKLISRTWMDPSPEVKQVMGEVFDEASFRFVRLLRQCCPHLDDHAFYWRLHAVFGAVLHASGGAARISYLSYGRHDAADVTHGLKELIHFLAAGLSADQLPLPVARHRRP